MVEERQLADLRAMRETYPVHRPPVVQATGSMGWPLFRVVANVGLWIGLNLMDVATSLVAFANGYSEGNYILRWVECADPWQLVAYKMGMILFILLPLAGAGKLHLLRWLNIGLGLVVVWNIIGLTVGGLLIW